MRSIDGNEEKQGNFNLRTFRIFNSRDGLNFAKRQRHGSLLLLWGVALECVSEFSLFLHLIHISQVSVLLTLFSLTSFITSML